MTQIRRDIESFIFPESVAVIRAVDRSSDPLALRKSYTDLYGENFYLVDLVDNTGGAIGDIPIYRSPEEIPHQVSLAIIRGKPEDVSPIIERCATAGIKNIMVNISGFRELNPEGAALEEDIGKTARRCGVRIQGPNAGAGAAFYRNTFKAKPIRGGSIALVTQSGHVGKPILQGRYFGIGFSGWVPTGNEVDLEVSDFIEYFAADDQTTAIACYVEGFRDGEKIKNALRIANEYRKPVIALKIGRTELGEQTAISHTGHLAGSDKIVDGLFRQYGVTRVDDIDELLETAALFAKLPSGTGNRVCCYTRSGALSALMAEMASENGIALPQLSGSTQAGLRRYLPPHLSTVNPVDNSGNYMRYRQPDDVTLNEESRRILELMVEDDNIDMLVVSFSESKNEDSTYLARDVLAALDTTSKPIIATWSSYKIEVPAYKMLVDSGIPVFRSFRNCFKALGDFARYETHKSLRQDRKYPEGASDKPVRLESPQPILAAPQARSVLASFGIAVVEQCVVTSPADASSAAAKLGFPVVMKVDSPAFPHKSDAGLVRLDIMDAPQAAETFSALMERALAIEPAATIEGVLVQPQIVGGVEMIVGVTRDPILGLAIMVGGGGILAEYSQDVAIRPLPIDALDVDDMLHSLQCFPLLQGVRGIPRADISALRSLILAVGRLAQSAGPQLRELDLNPVIVQKDGALVVDSIVVADLDVNSNL